MFWQFVHFVRNSWCAQRKLGTVSSDSRFIFCSKSALSNRQEPDPVHLCWALDHSMKCSTAWSLLPTFSAYQLLSPIRSWPTRWKFSHRLLSTSMPSPDLCLKLWVFNKNHLEKEMHVETLKRTVTMLFVLNPKNKRKKPSQFFFWCQRKGEGKKDSHLAKF